MIFEAAETNDLEVAMVALRGGIHIDRDEEERSARVDTYRGMRDARYVWNMDKMAAEIVAP